MIIYTDSQNIMRQLQDKPYRSQTLWKLTSILDKAAEWTPVTVTYCKAYIGIKGNERADFLYDYLYRQQ